MKISRVQRVVISADLDTDHADDLFRWLIERGFDMSAKQEPKSTRWQISGLRHTGDDTTSPPEAA